MRCTGLEVELQEDERERRPASLSLWVAAQYKDSRRYQGTQLLYTAVLTIKETAGCVREDKGEKKES